MKRAIMGGLIALTMGAGSVMIATTASADDTNCSDFATHEDAVAYFHSMGYTAENDPAGLDDVSGVGDGIPCESLPRAVSVGQPVEPVQPVERENSYIPDVIVQEPEQVAEYADQFNSK